METLYSLAVIVGLMKSYAMPPKTAVPAPIVQQNRVVEAVTKPRSSSKKRDSEWPLSY